MSNKWKNIIIKPDQPIKDAMRLIDSEALRIVLVTSSEDKLIGVVTDGDIRRGLLNNLDINSPVSLVMNTSPVTLQVGSSEAKVKRLMEEKDLLAIPILKDEMVVELKTIQEHKEKILYDNPVFLMAGGFGKRLRPLTDNTPKPLLKIGDKPILEIILQKFIDSGFYDFFISTHFMPEKITKYFGDGSKWNVNIRYVHEDKPLGTGGALGLLPKISSDHPLILMNGDILTNVNFNKILDFHNSEDAIATMCVREHEFQIPYGVVTGEGAKITSMMEKPINRCFINAGIYVLNKEITGLVKENERVDLPILLEKAIKQDKKVTMCPIHEYWLDIGRMEDFNRAQVDIKNLDL